MKDEMKSLTEDAAKLLGYKFSIYTHELGLLVLASDDPKDSFYFSPLDPNRGDLMKVARAAKLEISFEYQEVRGLQHAHGWRACEKFDQASYERQSLAIAVLRAASAVLKARGGK